MSVPVHIGRQFRKLQSAVKDAVFQWVRQPTLRDENGSQDWGAFRDLLDTYLHFRGISKVV